MNTLRKNRLGLRSAIIGFAILALVIIATIIILKLTAKTCKANPDGSFICEGCEVPASVYIDTYKTGPGMVWSPDCQYFAAMDRHGTSLNPYYHWTIYETTTWKPVCEVGEGDVMLGQGLVGGYCEFPLLNGQTWVVLGGKPHRNAENGIVRFKVCEDMTTCISPSDIPKLYDY